MSETVACILCGRPFSPTIEDPRGGLVCGAHGDDDLSALDLGSLWAGGDTYSRVLHDDPIAKLVGAWELGPDGTHAVYLLLDGGDLLVITPERRDVSFIRIPRAKRLLEAPKGLATHAAHPWPRLCGATPAGG
jgi:hypothetical protein